MGMGVFLQKEPKNSRRPSNRRGHFRPQNYRGKFPKFGGWGFHPPNLGSEFGGVNVHPRNLGGMGFQGNDLLSGGIAQAKKNLLAQLPLGLTNALTLHWDKPGLSLGQTSEGVNWGMGWVVVGTAVFVAPRFCIFLWKNAVFFRVLAENRGAPKTAVPTTTHPIPQLTPS